MGEQDLPIKETIQQILKHLIHIPDNDMCAKVKGKQGIESLPQKLRLKPQKVHYKAKFSTDVA